MADVTPKSYTQVLRAGTWAEYKAIASPNANYLYFCTDVGKVYKGTVDFTENVIYAAERPATPVTGKVYVIGATDTVEAYVNGAWKILSYPMAASTKDAEENDISTITASSTDMQVASAKNIYLAIQEAIEDLAGSTDVVKNITASQTAATLVKTFGDDSTDTVLINGVVTAPTWDASARILTIPVTGQQTPIEVNIGKDIFIDPEAANGYNKDTGNIDIYLNDGTEQKDPTKISIPAKELLNVYAGAESSTAAVVIALENIAGDGEDPVYEYKVRANVKISTATGNLISVDQEGLFASVDLTPYATTSDLNAATSALDTRITNNSTAIQANTTAIGVLNGDATTAGSVDKKIADAKSLIDADIATAQAAADAAQATADQNEADIAALAAATAAWGAFE